MAIVGIDLGTTFSAAAYINAYNIPETLINAEGERTTPSVVVFEDTNILVGRPAWNRLGMNEATSQI